MKLSPRDRMALKVFPFALLWGLVTPHIAEWLGLGPWYIMGVALGGTAVLMILPFVIPTIRHIVWSWRWARALDAPLRTAFWREHPEGWDNPCACDSCKEYASE